MSENSRVIENGINGDKNLWVFTPLGIIEIAMLNKEIAMLNNHSSFVSSDTEFVLKSDYDNLALALEGQGRAKR